MDDEKETKEESSSEEESGKVVIPESFQKEVTSLIDGNKNKACLSFIRDRVYAAEDELRKAEDEARMKKMKGNKKMEDFSDAQAPMSIRD